LRDGPPCIFSINCKIRAETERIPFATRCPLMKNSTKTLLALSLAAAFGGFAATAIRDGLEAPARAAPVAAAAAPAVAALPAAVGTTPLPSLAPMLARVTPAVVSVHTKQRVSVSPFGDDPMFRRMFPELTQERINESLGSGVIIDAQRGYVITNHHVIEGADAVSITLSDGRTLAAEFLGSDADTDIALMRIPAQNLSALPLGDSDALRVGDFVVAVGNPFGIGQTVTSGIVSAVGRTGLRGLGFQSFIQTDASINPGNSGGALVNLNGELVGINTASFNPRGSAAGNIGLGFAIPTSLARNVVNQLASNGQVVRGTLGLESQDVTAPLAKALGLDEARGALVTQVFKGSAAAGAGVRAGDVVVAANGERIDGRDALRNFEGLQPVGSRVALDVRRDGKPLQLSTTLREQPRSFAGVELDARLDGAVFAELPERLRQSGYSGVLVESVARGSRASRNGLQKDDVVIAASSGNFEDLPGFRASFTQAPAQLVLRVMRGANRRGDLTMQ
jgi:Do/DeqQ family serine protease